MESPLEKVGNQIFNVGLANLQIKEIGRIIQQQIPEAEVQLLEKFADKRSYNVSFEKIEGTLGFRAERSIEEGIQEIRKALDDGRIADPTDKIYYNHYAC